MVTYYKFRVFCKTEGKHKYVWNKKLPEYCPTNSKHEIDTGLTYTAFEDKLDSDQIVNSLKKIRERLTKKNISNDDIKIVLYYANWCAYSKQFLPIWNEFEKYMNNSMPGLVIEKKEHTDDYGITDGDKKLIVGYPTVILYLSDGKKVSFTEERTVENLVKFVDTNLNHKDINKVMKDSIDKMINMVLDTTEEFNSYMDISSDGSDQEEFDPSDLIIEI